MPSDRYDPNYPARGAESISPSDSNDLTYTTVWLYVGTTGDVKVTMERGEIVTFTNLAGGMAHPLRVTKVHFTSTTALGLIGLR